MNRAILALAIVFAMASLVSAEMDEAASSAINRPDFKIRNLPYKAETANPNSSDVSDAMPPSGYESPGPSMSGPSSDEIFSVVPEEMILRYIEQTDHEKRMTSFQKAEKYMPMQESPSGQGTGRVDSRDSTIVRWLMMSEKDQREAKLDWFQKVRSSISLDDFDRVVDLRAYRVLMTLNTSKSPGIRKVEPPRRMMKLEVEKLRHPELKPLGAEDGMPVGEEEAYEVSGYDPGAAPAETGSYPEEGLPEIPMISPGIRPIYQEPVDASYEWPEASSAPAASEYEREPEAEPEPESEPILKAPAPLISEPVFRPSTGPRIEPDEVPREKVSPMFGIPSGLRNGP